MRLSRSALGVVASTVLVSSAAADSFVIRGASIVDVETGTLIQGQDLVITDGLIERLAPAGQPAPGATEVKANGLFAMPGLFDAHVHLMASIETYPTMLVAHGVTSARDLGGPTEIVITLRDDCRTGAVLGPDLIVTGAIIDGDPPVWPFSEPCDTPEEGRAAVQKLRAAGVDMIKVYSRLNKDVYEAVIDEAHKAGLKVTGHIPESVTLKEALAAGHNCNEHLMRIDAAIAGLAGKEEERNRAINRTFAGWAHFDEVPEEKLLALAKEVAAAGMMQCPTISVMQGIGRTRDAAAFNDPLMAYVPLNVREFWAGDMYTGWSEYAGALVPTLQKTIAVFHRAGVPMMVGTDLANPFILAGRSVHGEMVLWQEAGIPAPDVLRAATIVPARFCGVDASLGSIAPGKKASIVLTRANPLADVRNAEQIEHVFLRGRHFDRAALDGLLAGVREAIAAESAAPKEVDEPVTHGLPGEEISRGKFRYTFGKFPAGEELFVMTRSEDGFHLFTDARPKGGGAMPSTITAHATPEGRVHSVKWHQRAAPPVEATYTIAAGTITAIAKRGGEAQPEQVTKLEEGHVFTISATASTFFEYRALGLKPGESRQLTSLSFGFPDWRIQPAPYKVTRNPDTTIELNGVKTPCANYQSELTTPFGVFKAEAWLDDNLIPYRSVLNMPFGVLSIDRE